MDSTEIVNVLSRWLHIGTAIVVVGGTAFLRFVLLPSAQQLPQAEHDQLRQLVMRRWRKIVMAGIGLFLLTGFYNYLAVGASEKHRNPGLYHSLMGLKILFALGIFFLASTLVGRAARFDAIRRGSKKWLLLLLAMAFFVVLISSFLKVTRP